MYPLRRGLLLSWAVAAMLVFSAPASANVELKPDTVAGFDTYVRVTEDRMARDEQNGCFLVMDKLPAPERAAVYEQLKRGDIYIRSVRASEDDTPLHVTHGLIHDWVAIMFVPGVTMQQTIDELQDYADQPKKYWPTVRQAHVIERDGNEIKNFRQLYRKQIVTAVIDADFDDIFEMPSTTQLTIRSRSTRIAEVADFGQPTEHELPVGNDHGYVWRFYNYWHVEEKDGGVYLQVESITLSRTVPFIFAWLVNPLIKSIPRDVLTTLLNKTRNAILARKAANEANEGPVHGPRTNVNLSPDETSRPSDCIPVH